MAPTSDDGGFVIHMYEHVASRNFPLGIPVGCHDDYRIYTTPSTRLYMCGREWPELVVVPEYLLGDVITHCFCTSKGFEYPDGPELANAVVYGKVARYRECVKRALAGAGKVVVHAD